MNGPMCTGLSRHPNNRLQVGEGIVALPTCHATNNIACYGTSSILTPKYLLCNQGVREGGLGYEPEGRLFESARAHHNNSLQLDYLRGLQPPLLLEAFLAVCLEVCPR